MDSVVKNDCNCCAATCNTRLACLRVFLKYLGGKEIDYLYLYHNATLIPQLKEPKTKVKGMSKNAVRALLSVPDVTNKTGRRNLALISLLYATACRIDEVLSLKTGSCIWMQGSHILSSLVKEQRSER